jgi:hypothetical protein
MSVATIYFFMNLWIILINLYSIVYKIQKIILNNDSLEIELSFCYEMKIFWDLFLI